MIEEHCYICNQIRYCLFHHLNYDTYSILEVKIPVCRDCHSRIHSGELWFLDPRQLRPPGIQWVNSNHLYDTRNSLTAGRVVDVSKYLTEIEIVGNSKYLTAVQKRRANKRIRKGLKPNLPFLPAWRPPPINKKGGVFNNPPSAPKQEKSEIDKGR